MRRVEVGVADVSKDSVLGWCEDYVDGVDVNLAVFNSLVALSLANLGSGRLPLLHSGTILLRICINKS
jgi:hypothetical protein